MCGILLHHISDQSAADWLTDEFIEFDEEYIQSKQCSDTSTIFNSIVPYITARGPNYSSFRVSREHSTSWFSSLLSLREPCTIQSVNVNDRYILQFNGELYNSEIQHNDTQFIVSQLELPNPEIPLIVKSLEGEFAYTIYDMEERKFYFGRDNVGKRSLSYRLDDAIGELYVSSVTGVIKGFTDCIAGVLYMYDVQEKKLSDADRIAQPYYVSEEVDENLTNMADSIEKLYKKLELAVEKRVTSIHPVHAENSPIAVLFSGGLDCSVIASLVCAQLGRTFGSRSNVVVELLNVAFENPRTGTMPCNTPDRKLAINSAAVLQDLFPHIEIRLVEIDVPYKDYLMHRPEVIKLMYPKNTEMDLSIAIAFYFASMGSGIIKNSNGETERYQRKGIVLFSGLGADELYGGYHKFANKSPKDLTEELSKQINNIYERNLNRDDKVIACNGVEVRYPFLDEQVIEFSTQHLPVNYKVNKMILRLLAQEKLNLQGICEEPKRAIQFGTKSAKMTKDGNKHGTDILK